MSRVSKIAAVLLLFAFLATSMGSVYGFVICDHGCLGRIHHQNHHTGEQNNDPAPLPYYPSPDSQDDTCHDDLIKLGDGCLDEEFSFEQTAQDLFPTAIATFVVTDIAPNNSLPTKFKVFTSIRPQALLTHRSTVLII